MKHCLGLQPPRPESVRFQLADILDHRSIIPNIPANFGHANLISRWGMLGNGPDSDPNDIPVGDCADAGPEHIIMAVSAAAGRPVPPFTYASTIAMYTATSGFDPSQYDPATGQNPTDRGGDMTAIAQYWQSQGFKDAAGDIHTIRAFLGINPRDLAQVAAACYLFDGAVGMGFNLPESAEEQFNNGEPWSVTDAPIVGGHYVPIIGRQGGLYQGVSWGGIVNITPEFIQEYGMMGLVYWLPEIMNLQAKTAEGFDAAHLTADLSALEAI